MNDIFRHRQVIMYEGENITHFFTEEEQLRFGPRPMDHYDEIMYLLAERGYFPCPLCGSKSPKQMEYYFDFSNGPMWVCLLCVSRMSDDFRNKHIKERSEE